MRESSDLALPKWHEIVSQLRLTGGAAELVTHCILNSVKGDNISLSLAQSTEDLLTKSIQLQIETALAEYYNRPVKLKIDIKDLINETPAERIKRKQQKRQLVAEDLIKNDPFVKDLQNRFNAQIVLNSIKPK